MVLVVASLLGYVAALKPRCHKASRFTRLQITTLPIMSETSSHFSTTGSPMWGLKISAGSAFSQVCLAGEITCMPLDAGGVTSAFQLGSFSWWGCLCGLQEAGIETLVGGIIDLLGGIVRLMLGHSRARS